MKKKCRSLWITKFVLIALASSSSFESQANVVLDRRYAMETITYVRAWDNVDGLFGDYIKESYDEYFAKQNRFKVIDPRRVQEVLDRSKFPYQKILEDKKVLGQVSRTLRVESLIRTKVTKEGPEYRFVLDWLHAPKMQELSKFSFKITEPRGGQIGRSTIKEKLSQGLDELFKKIPYVGHVTGRDGQWVTLNIGDEVGLKKDDELVVGTLEEVKRHPLLDKIVDWHFSETGRLIVDKVENNLVFCRIQEEAKGRKISNYQKITKIIPGKPKPEQKNKQPMIVDETKVAQAKAEKNPPRWGYGMLGPLVGAFTRAHTSDTANGTGGLIFGAQAGGQLWMNRRFALDAEAGYATGSLLKILIAARYTHYILATSAGPRIWGRVGYQSVNYSLTTASVGFGGLFVGIGGKLPVRGKWGGLLAFDLGVLNSVSETGVSSGTSTGKSLVNFFLGGYYNWTSKMVIRGGIDVGAQSADFDGGTTLSHRTISFTSGLMYYF